jgi:WD40 repeat protein
MTSILILSISYCFGKEAKLVTQQSIRSTITDFKFSPEGGYLANISEADPSINIWHLASQKIIGTLQEYDEEVVEFSFNSNGDELVSLHKDKLLIRWDLNSWSLKDSSRLEYLPDWIEFSNQNVFVGRAGEVNVLDKNLNSIKVVKVKGTPSSSFVDNEHV